MIDFLNNFDIWLFHFINGTLRNPLFDAVMPVVTDLNKYRIILVSIAFVLLWMFVRGDRRLRLALLLLIATIIFSDQLSSSVIKYWFARPRPCHVLHNVRLLVDCGSGLSFPSAHAVNNFAGALILTFFFPKGSWWFFGFAMVIAYSRIYVGVHYPFDVIGGSIIGLLCGGCVLFVYSGVQYFWNRHGYEKSKIESA